MLRTRSIGLTSALAMCCALGQVAPSEAAEYLVWLDAGDEVETHWITDEGGQLHDRGHADALVVAAGGGLWVWQTAPYLAPACRCGDVDLVARDGLHGQASCPEDDAGHSATVTDLLGGASITVVAPRTDVADGRRTQRITLVGVAGSYVVLQVDVTEEHCQDGPTTVSHTLVFDVASGEATSLIAADERGRIGVRERVTAQRALQRAGVILDAEASNALQLTLLIPRYTLDGLELTLQYTAPTCSACPDDGLWSSRTRSERVEALQLPAALEAFALVPAAVADFLQRAGGDVQRFGYSTIGGGLDHDAALAALQGRLPGVEHTSGDDGLSGRYQSALGALDLVLTRDGVVGSYRTLFSLDQAADDVCDCAFAGVAERSGYAVDPAGTMLIPTEGRIRLTGAAPGCCNATWAGDDLSPVGGLTSCTVTAEWARFFDDEALTSPTRAFVMSGDNVEIVAPWASLSADVIYARFRGDVAATTGYLSREVLSCP